MVDTALLLSSEAMAQTLLKSSGGLMTLLKTLGERANKAQEDYQSLRLPAGNDSLEQRRIECLRRLSEIRNRSTLCVTSKELQQRVLCLAMEQTINAYEATTERNLDLVLVNVGQIEAVLQADSENNNRRRHVRRIAVGVSLTSLLLICGFVGFAQWANVDSQRTLPFIGIPPCVVFWSAIGSFAAILYRFTNAGDGELEDPVRWLFSRPITGIIMGAITYLVLKAGLLAVAPQTGSGTIQPLPGAVADKTNEIMWLVAFLAGFSDRFSEGILRSLVGRFGGNKTDELVTLDVSASRTTVLDLLPRSRGAGQNPDGDTRSQTPTGAGVISSTIVRETTGVAASTSAQR